MRFSSKAEKFHIAKRCISLLLILCLLPVRPVLAANEDVGISYYEFTQVKKNKIKTATLFIGTYMIELPGLSGTNYTDAMTSRETYKQDNKLYFTELDGKGNWRNIADASDIAKILPGSETITEQSIYDLRITCYIGADGVPRDPSTMGDNNPFLNPDPYDFDRLPEFKDSWALMRNAIDISRLARGTGMIGNDKFVLEQAMASDGRTDKEALDAFFADDRLPTMYERDDTTNLMDKGVEHLWEHYTKHKAKSETAEAEKAEIIYDTISKADATRRALVFERLAVNADFFPEKKTMFTALFELIGTDEGTEEAYASLSASDKRNVKTRLRDITAAFETAQKNSKESYANYSAKRFVRGSTAADQYDYDVRMDLLSKSDGKESDIDNIVTTLLNIQRIKDDNINDAKAEYKIITEILIPMQDKNMESYLAEGVPSGYPVTTDSALSKSMLESQQKSAANAVAEAKSYITKMRSRSEDYKAQIAVVEKEIAWCVGVKSRIRQDDYAKYAEKVRADYEAWLRAVLQELKDLDGQGKKTSGNQTNAKIAYLKNEMKYAKQFDNPKKVKELKEQIKREKAKTKKSSNKSKKSKSSSGSKPYKPDSYKNGVPSTEKTSSNQTNSNAPTRSTSGNDGTSGDTTVADSGNDADQTAISGELSMDDLNALLEALFGAAFDDLPSNLKGAVVAALNEFGLEHDNESVLELSRTLLAQIMDEHNEFVYEKYLNNPNTEYVSFACIDRARMYTRYRYVRRDLEATMSYLGGGTSYTYNIGSAEVVLSGGGTEKLSAAVVDQTDPYIRGSQTVRYAYLDETDAQRKLDVRAEYIDQTHYAVLVTGSMEQPIRDIIAALEALFTEEETEEE